MEKTLSKVLSFEKAKISLLNDRLVEVLIEEHAYLEKEDLEKINSMKYELVENNPYCLIFKAPKYGGISADGRAFSASAVTYKNCIAKALLVPSLSSRIISNFFIKFHKPQGLTKVFNNEKEALMWLEKQFALNSK